jgi:hypothetical protein
VGDETVFVCNTDVDDDFDPADWTYDDARFYYDRLSEEIGEWQGVPMALDQDDLPLVLHEKHPLRDLYNTPTAVEVVVGGPPHDVDPEADLREQVVEAFRCAIDETERIVNRWYDASHNREVLIFNRGFGAERRAFAVTIPRAPDSSMDRLDLWMRTMMASDAWDTNAELKAMEKLAGLVTNRQMRHYMLTGAFLETSSKTGLTYHLPTVTADDRADRPTQVVAVEARPHAMHRRVVHAPDRVLRPVVGGLHGPDRRRDRAPVVDAWR